MRSAKPSPLTSPAEATGCRTTIADAVEPEAVVPLSAERSSWRQSPRPCRTPHSSILYADRQEPDDVGEAVAIDVAGRGNRPAAADSRSAPSRRKPFLPLRVAKFNGGGKARSLAEHDILFAVVLAAVGIAARGPDDQVGKAIAIDITRRCD